MKTIIKLALGVFVGLVLATNHLSAQVQGAAVFASSPACQGSPVNFTFSSAYTGGVTRYEWDFGDQSPLLVLNTWSDSIVSHSFAQPGVYQVMLKVYYGLPLQSFTLVHPIMIHAIPAADFKAVGTCIDSTAAFTSLSHSNDSALIRSYFWDFGDGSGDVNPNPKHYYPFPGVFMASLTVENSAGCRATSVSKPVNVYRLPDAKIEYLNSQLCQGGSMRLLVNPYYDHYLWSTTTHDTTWYYDVPADLLPGTYEFLVNIYEVHLEDFKICFSKDSVEVTIHPLPNDLDIAVQNLSTGLEITTEPIVNRGDSIQLNLSSSSFTLNQIQWFPPQMVSNPFIANPTAIISDPMRFMVNVTDQFGCTGSTEIDIRVLGDFYISNLVTPNNDGFNDTWIVQNEAGMLDENWEVTIFNRWGEEVLNQKGYQNDWNGVYSNRELPEGAYYYLIKGNSTSFTGSITLVR